RDTDRYVGSSGSSARRAPVCVRDPGAAPAPEPAPQDPVPPAEDPAEEPAAPAEDPVPGLPADPPAASGVACGELGVGASGRCEDGLALRCVNGVVQAADCAAFGQPCGVGAGRQAACVPLESATPRNLPQCPAAGFVGTCQANVAIWCENSASFAVDCTWFGKACTPESGDGLGYWCR
ncbi:MAG: hypothetical protein KC613_15425, partial [Myxococcales bacterium]|nr:hypothetical protein [Myxococcales bacterium]